MEKRFIIPMLAVCLAVVFLGTTISISAGASSSGGSKITKSLGVGESNSDLFAIPKGSTVMYLPGGVTEIYDSNNNLWMSIRDEDVGLVLTPKGLQKATKVFEVPNGALVTGATKGVTEVYGPEGDLIFKIVDNGETQGSNSTQLPSESVAPQVVWYGGWVEDAYAGQYNDVNYFFAQWNCPSKNTTLSSACALFPDVEGDGANGWINHYCIAQPVLQYNQNGQKQLNGQAWLVRDDNVSIHSGTTPVSVGNALRGAISENTDGYWWITFRNDTTSKVVWFKSNLMGHTHQEIDTALEGYNLNTNADLFGTCDFYNMVVWRNSVPYSVPWAGEVLASRTQFPGLAVNIFGSAHTQLATGH